LAIKLKTTRTLAQAEHSLVYGFPGVGKTDLARHMLDAYGPGLFVDVEGGTRTIQDIDIPVMQVTSWAGESNPDEGVFNFGDVMRLLSDAGFRKENNINWAMFDSLTALADYLMSELEKKYSGDKNGFKKFSEYADKLTGAMRLIKGLPIHTITTALAKDETDDNGTTDYWPAIQGSKAQKQVPGIFDNVIALVKRTEGPKENPEIHRFMVIDHVNGWHGKIRTPYPGRFKPVIKGTNIAKLFRFISMPEAEYQAFLEARKAEAEKAAA
jgi:hypothetical protein